MESVVEFLVHQGSYGLLFLALVVAGLGIPLPEDLVMISGAILVQRGLTNFALTVAVLAVGVLIGDTILFFMARRVGTGIYNWRIVKRVMPPARREWLEQKIAKHGGLVVFCARHVAGFRAPTFAICAIHGIPYRRFILFDALGLTISLPLWMAIGWFFGDSIDQLMNHTASAERIVTAVALGIVILGLTIHAIVSAFRRKREEAARNSLPSS